MKRLSVRERTAVLRARPDVVLDLRATPRRLWTTDYSADHQPIVLSVAHLRFLEGSPR